MSFQDFYFKKTNRVQCELKDVKRLEVTGSDITSADLARMAVVEHLICKNCTMETLAPLLNSPLQKLTLVGCKIRCQEEKGQSFATLRSLVLNDVSIFKERNLSQLILEVELPLEHLEYDLFIANKEKNI